MLAGSVVSNILLVLGAALIFGGGDAREGKPLDRFSLLLQLGLVLVAVLLFFVPSVPGWSGCVSPYPRATRREPSTPAW